jgi:succinate dehydrogenase flavin-adding protein (antitoxin of CptAB toxin-antitoxin module)
MTRLEALEQEVEKLTPEDYQAFRRWLADHDWQLWDEELERNVAAGKLDKLRDEALAEWKRGETTEI